jgi:hypothetical protein
MISQEIFYDLIGGLSLFFTANNFIEMSKIANDILQLKVKILFLRVQFL